MKPRSSRLSVFAVSMIFLLLHILFKWEWSGFVSLIIGISGILSSFISRQVDRGLMKINRAIGKIIQTIILTILFFVLLFPISLLYRLFNKDQLMLSRKYKSYFVDTKSKVDKESLEKPW